jgi:hypothetical protein
MEILGQRKKPGPEVGRRVSERLGEVKFRDCAWASFWRPFGACPALHQYPRLAPWAAFLSPLRGWGSGAELCSGRLGYGASLRWTGESPVPTWLS